MHLVVKDGEDEYMLMRAITALLCFIVLLPQLAYDFQVCVLALGLVDRTVFINMVLS